jgi:hypothetical protein
MQVTTTGTTRHLRRVVTVRASDWLVTGGSLSALPVCWLRGPSSHLTFWGFVRKAIGRRLILHRRGHLRPGNERDRMPACFGRQGAPRCAVLAFLLAAAVFVCPARGDDNGGLSEILGIPRIVNSPQYSEINPSQSTQGGTSSSQSQRGRAMMEERVRTIKRPSSAKAARKEGLAALPLDKMSPENRERVAKIANDNSMFRELPTYRFQVDPRCYYFFMKHPDVAVSIWRVMQISEFQMRQTAANKYETDDSDGTSGIIDLAYRGENEVVVVCNGAYRSPLLPKSVKANGVLHVKVSFERDPNGKTYATHSARLFVTFPSQTFDTVARIMSPLSNAIIDQNFREVSLFLHMMSMAMERQPGWVENVSSRLENVLPERRTQLMEVTVDVYADANPHARHVARRGESATDDRDPFGNERPTRTVYKEDSNSGSVTPATSRQ